MTSRTRRITLIPLNYVCSEENKDIANTFADVERKQMFEKKRNHKRSMAASLKRSPSIEKIMKDNKNKSIDKDSDTVLKQELEDIKRRASIISKQRLPSPPSSPPPLVPLPSPPPPNEDFYYDFSEYQQKRSSIKIAILGDDLNEVIGKLKTAETIVKQEPIISIE